MQANIAITDSEGTIIKSESFVAIILEKSEPLLYASALSNTKDLSLAHRMVIISGIIRALSELIEEVASNVGVELIHEYKDKKGGEDGDSNAS
jgi:hypothetical protein